jgi:glucoamylase
MGEMARSGAAWARNRRRRLRRLAPVVAALGTLCLALAAAAPAGAASSAATQPAVAAPGGPGTPSYFDLARKDCVGTARNTGSKVWYTVAGGVLSDVYEPTIDNTNVATCSTSSPTVPPSPTCKPAT